MEIVKIERALPIDHHVLTQITKNSKAFWEYTKEQMSEWENNLTITTRYLTENETYKLVLNDQIIGYYSFIRLAENHLKLDNLFLLQNFIGKGFGQLLLNDLLERAQESNSIDIILEADPNAENFYKKFGFVTYDQRESSIKGRFLPQMRLEFNNTI